MDFNEEKAQEIHKKWELMNEHLREQNIPWLFHQKILGNFSMWLREADNQCIDSALIDMLSISVNLPKVFAMEVLIATHKRLRDSGAMKSQKKAAHDQACLMISKCRYLGGMTKTDSVYYACNLLFNQCPEYKLKTNSLEKKYDKWEKQRQLNEARIIEDCQKLGIPPILGDSSVREMKKRPEIMKLWTKEKVSEYKNSLPPLPDELIGDR